MVVKMNVGGVYTLLAGMCITSCGLVKKETVQFARNTSHNFKFGAHVAAAGGISNAILNALRIGANSFAFFLKSPRKWDAPQYPDAEVAKFKALCAEHKYDPMTDILPHGQYMINLGNPEPEKEAKSYESFVDELKRCEQLGVGMYNFHPGSSVGSDHKESLVRLAKNINNAIAETSFVKLVIENMAGQGSIIGATLEDIRDVIEMVDNKERVGVCIDTCHSYAAGFDITTEEKLAEFLQSFDDLIGAKYLCAIHLNDSKAPCGGNRDLHQSLGQGFIGLELFRLIANSKRLEGIPIVLETPMDKDDSVWGEEIKLLESLIGKQKDDAEFVERTAHFSKLGQKEREEHMKKFSKKQEVKAKRGAKTDIISQLTKKRK
ncbi:hypothetical protein BABINDRAFT_11075 [Babjeviella inositovora NRRL Y-12698]|uniref:Apurinic-apyrimidinic endonuclease 1 n=1 Tax=Babjeviella inositovora NRRL Y-12698 TaxID=984486 RepID=A0A1E3QYE3_9ASCO|nr:uncharacterized protein BABINDRAFT_11075 [Babjeviella inositovora NRRL Y-12698]ODQ82690.1 hypothetical protein BABINDRAFT_11075 [Babjeviella inositovora NRRL Y-12698]